MTEPNVPANDVDDGPAYTLTRRQLEDLVIRAVRAAQAKAAETPLVVDRQDLARQLGCSAGHVDHLRHQGMPTLMVGKAVRFEPAKVMAWLREQQGAAG